MSELENWVKKIDSAGHLWVAAKLKADQLDEDCKPFLSSLKNAIEGAANETLSEAKIDRLAQGSKQYREYVQGMVTARAEALRRLVRYNAMKDAFEAARSDQSLEREKIAKGIFHQGR